MIEVKVGRIAALGGSCLSISAYRGTRATFLLENPREDIEAIIGTLEKALQEIVELEEALQEIVEPPYMTKREEAEAFAGYGYAPGKTRGFKGTGGVK